MVRSVKGARAYITWRRVGATDGFPCVTIMALAAYGFSRTSRPSVGAAGLRVDTGRAATAAQRARSEHCRLLHRYIAGAYCEGYGGGAGRVLRADRGQAGTRRADTRVQAVHAPRVRGHRGGRPVRPVVRPRPAAGVRGRRGRGRGVPRPRGP